MSILQLAAAAAGGLGGGGGETGPLDSITANWANINLTWPTLNGSNANVNVTFSVGATRTLKVTWSGVMLGSLLYDIDDTSTTSCPKDTEIEITSGEDLRFYYYSDGYNESKTVTVQDVDKGENIDTFTVSMSGGTPL